MEPILKTIAREYLNRYRDIKSFCFLFPNKRCGIFLKKYLAEEGMKGDQMPHILTISEFACQIARKTEASRIEQLFILYKAYNDILEREDQSQIEFEEFRGWGETLLSDFNTVDLYLDKTDGIFKNIKDYREISSNFLTDDQKEIMKEYFGIEDFGDVSSFWKHFSNKENLSYLKKRFLNLWQILGPLHNTFVSRLSSKGLGSTGSIFREAVEIIKKKEKRKFPYNKIVIVGFNALTGAEREIFKYLKNLKSENDYDSFTDFIWDLSGPILNNHNFNASRFVMHNKKLFPSPEWIQNELEKTDNKTYPDFRIISAPTLTSQTKVAGEILKEFETQEGKRRIADTEVALVLPDESLLSNMLYSLPENIGDINLTMGYSLRLSSIASFMNLFRRTYVNMHEMHNDWIFYCKDLKRLLSHPYSTKLFGSEEVEKILEYINTYHKISIKRSEIESLAPNFKELLNLPSKNIKTEEIFFVLDKIYNSLIEKMSEQEINPENSLDIDQIKIYSEYVSGLKESIDYYRIALTPIAVIKLVDKLISNEKIGFEGEPLEGLQIMGTLETRSLDFKNLIILSMNEGIIPRKAFGSTFIPETLRKAYGLPPNRYAEEIFGYYFYRLISRADKVTLIYDGRTISGLRGGISRYILQLLQYVPKEKITKESWQYRLQNEEIKDVSIEKNQEIFKLTECFTCQDSGRKNFSASSLNTYRECQIKFFLENILNINSDPEKSEYIDAITIGNILHNVMMEIYLPTHQKKLLSNPVIIDKEYIATKLSQPDLINRLIVKNINYYYYGNKKDSNLPVESGVTEIVAQQIATLVMDILKYDIKLTPFKLYGCEISETLRVTLRSGRTVNFKFAIDRLDEIEIDGEKRLRIVDYKTGSKKRYAKNLEEIFEGGYSSEQIFQLFTYAWLLGKIGKEGWEDVMTEIYYVPDLISGKGGLPEIDNKKITTFRPFIEDFSQRIENLIESIFISPVFKETKDPQTCGFCPFKTFCGK